MATISLTSDAGLAEITAKLSHTIPADGPRLRIDVGDDLSVVLDRHEWNELVRQGNAAFDNLPPRRPGDEYSLTRNSLGTPVTDRSSSTTVTGIHTQLPKGLL